MCGVECFGEVFFLIVQLCALLGYYFSKDPGEKNVALFHCNCHLVFQCIEGENTWRDLMKTALENLIVLLKDENTISPYEMCSSGLVQSLLTVLNNVSLQNISL